MSMALFVGMLNTTVIVPTEIVDHVLGFLHSDEDYSTLETCSAVFPQLVEHHIYSQITFTQPPKPTTTFKDGSYDVDPTKFSLTLIDRPYVANYVRSVRILIQDPFGQDQSDLSVISSILPRLSQITAISLETRHLSLPWPLLNSKLHTAFHNSLRLPSIKRVAISCITDFPVKLLEHCENITHLRLPSNCIDDGVVPTSSSYPSLSSLGVAGQSDMMIARIVSWFKSNTLHTLVLFMKHGMNFTQFRTLIEACSHTLVNLEFEGLEFTDLIFPVLRVQLPLLERITIRSPIISFNSRNYLSVLPVFTPFLLSIPSTIRPICLCFHLAFLSHFSDFDWPDIAALLVLPIFSRIELYVKARNTSFPDIVSSLKRDFQLKRLYETGKLVIEPSTS